jgi:nonsense-mediated mRNA decay protein 3
VNGFCVECGKETDRTVNGLCLECFLKDRQLLSLPDHVDLQVCTGCGQFYRHGEFRHMEPEEAAVQAAVEVLECIPEARVTSVSPALSWLDDSNVSVILTCKVAIGDFETEAAAGTIVRIKNTVCKICSRRTGNYYEAILQVRSAGKTLDPELQDEVLARVEKLVDAAMATDPNAFITKMEIVPGGVDVYLSLIALGRACERDLADTYAAETDESSKLVGQTRDGLDMYRVTCLVRLPEFHVGDVVRYKDKYWLLSRVSGKGGKLISLENFRETSIDRREMPDIKVYAKYADLMRADVISSSGNEVQVLDPSDYSTVDLLVPQGAVVGESVKVVRIEETLYYVPLRGEKNGREAA